MLREVISTQVYRPARTNKGASAIIDTLECGHKSRRKGSDGLASRRMCQECRALKNGTIMIIGGVKQLWDEARQMPYNEDGSEI